MDKSSTPPRNRLTRSSTKKKTPPSSKKHKEENKDQSNEDLNKVRKSRRKTDVKATTNGGSPGNMDRRKSKNVSDMSEGYESENSVNEKRSSSPKAQNHKTPSPTISRKSLRLRRSTTPAPEGGENNTPRKMRRSSSYSQLEPKSAPRNRRAQSVNKDFVYSPSKTKPESDSSKLKSCSKLEIIDKIDEVNEESSQDSISLSTYVQNLNQLKPTLKDTTTVHNSFTDTIKLETDEIVNVETGSISEPNNASSDSENNQLSQNLTVIEEERDSNYVETEIIANDETDSITKSYNANSNATENKFHQNPIVMPIIEEESRNKMADDQNIQSTIQSVIVTSNLKVSNTTKNDLSQHFEVLPVIKEEDTVDREVQPLILTDETVVENKYEKAATEDNEDQHTASSDVKNTYENIVKGTICDEAVENSTDNLDVESIPDNSNNMKDEGLCYEDSIEEKSAITRSRSESQTSIIDAPCENDETNTEQSDYCETLKNISPGIGSIPVPGTHIYENNNDTFIQALQSEEININQEIDLQSVENSDSVSEANKTTTQSVLNQEIDLQNVENSDSISETNKTTTQSSLSPIPTQNRENSLSSQVSDENNDVMDKIEKPTPIDCEDDDGCEVLIDDSNDAISEKGEPKMHLEPTSENGDSYNCPQSYQQKPNDDVVELYNQRAIQYIDSVLKSETKNQQCSNDTVEDNMQGKRFFNHTTLDQQLVPQTEQQVDNDYKFESDNIVEIINDTPSECSESNSDIYKDLSENETSELMLSPNNDCSDKYVSDDDDDEEEEEGDMEEQEEEFENEEELEEEGEDLEEEEDDEEEEKEDEENEEREDIKKENKITKENVGQKDESLSVQKDERTASFQITELKESDNVFDTEQPITYDKALEILNKDRENKINDDEFFEMFTEELNKVSAEEADSDSDIAIVDEWIPENLPKPKPVIKGIKRRPPQRPQRSLPQPAMPRNQHLGNQQVGSNRGQAPYREQTPYRMQTPYRVQAPQNQIPINSISQMQGMNYSQDAMYGHYNNGMAHIDSSREQFMYNQYGAPNYNMPGPGIYGPGNGMDNYSHAGMFNHPQEYMSGPSMQFSNTQEMEARNADAMRSHPSTSQDYSAETGRASLPELPDMSRGPQPKGSLNSSPKVANLEDSTPNKKVVKTKSTTSCSEDGDKKHTPVLNLLNIKPEQVTLLKKVLGIIDKSYDEKMRESPYVRSPKSTKQKSDSLKSNEEESESRQSKKEFLKRFLEGDRTLSSRALSSKKSSSKALSSRYSQKHANERQVNLEEGSVIVTVAQKEEKSRWKANTKTQDRKRTFDPKRHSEKARLKRMRRKHNRRLRLTGETSGDTTYSDSSDSSQEISMLHKKRKRTKSGQSTSSSSDTGPVVPRPSKLLKRSNKSSRHSSSGNVKMVQRKTQKKEPTVLKSNSGMFTVNSVTSTSSDLEATSGSSSEYAQEFRRQIQPDLDSRRNKISNIFSQLSSQGNKRNKRKESSSLGSKIKKGPLRKLPDDVLEELNADARSSKKRGFTTTDSDRPTKRRKKSSKIRVKSAAAEEEYIPYVTAGATQFALNRLDKEGVLGVAHKASNFRNSQLYGSPIKRITSKELVNIKKKQQLNASQKIVKKKDSRKM